MVLVFDNDNEEITQKSEPYEGINSVSYEYWPCVNRWAICENGGYVTLLSDYPYLIVNEKGEFIRESKTPEIASGEMCFSFDGKDYLRNYNLDEPSVVDKPWEDWYN